ncbi:hypothetical protein IGB42_02292 [Andreprevotia sp. IGB-42]|uniref:hypothetical protein n=1 Tax=Andreprevotia sp. IGB-42 TaxID=2497473 RepID=UPI001357A301|nr:hypothetical protein [Andreprevotia sp. IGB-42]KAF0813363.1 hypothetical protein IGB42_02292 [Andreprevotia sp. IGB-42]
MPVQHLQQTRTGNARRSHPLDEAAIFENFLAAFLQGEGGKKHGVQAARALKAHGLAFASALCTPEPARVQAMLARDTGQHVELALLQALRQCAQQLVDGYGGSLTNLARWCESAADFEARLMKLSTMQSDALSRFSRQLSAQFVPVAPRMRRAKRLAHIVH